MNKICANKGQQAVEFAILLGLLFITCLGILYIFGDKVAAFFQTNSIASQKSITNKETFNPYSQPKIQKSETISGYQVDYLEDGSVVMNIEGQKLNYPKEFVDVNNIFSGSTFSSNFEQTTGATGIEFIVNEIASMIKDHKSDYPNTDVPIKVMYGTGSRNCSNSEFGSNYSGNTEANIVSLKVGNDVVLIQNDQTCEQKMGDCIWGGIYKIAGTIQKDNTLKANVSVTSFDSSITHPVKSINAQLSETNNGLTVNSKDYSLINAYNNEMIYDWTMNFNKKF